MEADKRMLDIIFIILIFLAILLMFYSINEKGIAFALIDSILWIILAMFLLQGIEIPYEMFNATSGNIETGVHYIGGGSLMDPLSSSFVPLTYLFSLLGLIMFIVFVYLILETLYDAKKLKI